MRKSLPLNERLRHRIFAVHFLEFKLIKALSEFVQDGKLVNLPFGQVVNLALDDERLSKAVKLINITKRVGALLEI